VVFSSEWHAVPIVSFHCIHIWSHACEQALACGMAITTYLAGSRMRIPRKRRGSLPVGVQNTSWLNSLSRSTERILAGDDSEDARDSTVSPVWTL
jgi:hypothetical protein